MKTKRFFLSATMLLAMLAVTAGNPDKLFNEFKSLDNVEYVKVPRALLWAAKASGSLNHVPAARKITGLKVLLFNNSADIVKNRFESRLKQESEGYEEIIRVNSDDSCIRMFSQTDGNKFRDIYIWAGDAADATFVRLCGTFTANDLSNILNDK